MVEDSFAATDQDNRAGEVSRLDLFPNDRVDLVQV